MPTYDVLEATLGNDSGSRLNIKDGTAVFFAKRSWTIAVDTAGLSSKLVQDTLQGDGRLPLEGDAHPDNGALVCQGLPAVRRISPIFFEAEANYESIPISTITGGNIDDDPWNQPTIRRSRSVTQELEVDEDYNGNAIVNPGTNEFVPVKRRFSDIVVTLRRAFIVYSDATQSTYMDKTNSDAYLTFQPGQGLVQSIQSELAIHRDIPYYNVTTELYFRNPYRTTAANAWYHRRAVKGYLEFYTGNFDLVRRALDDEGRETPEPVLLDKVTGERLPPGSPAQFLETQLYGSIAFSTLGY